MSLHLNIYTCELILYNIKEFGVAIQEVKSENKNDINMLSECLTLVGKPGNQ